MNAAQHLLIGALAGAIALALLGGPFTLPAAAAVAMGALLPDADHHKTKMFQVVSLAIGIGAFFLSKPLMQQRFGEFNGGIASLGIGIIAMILFRLFKPKHRGITHTLFAAALYAAAVFFLSAPQLAVAGFAAYASHLLADGHVKAI